MTKIEFDDPASPVLSGQEFDLKELVTLMYRELRRIAAARLARERSDISLSPTELVHEAYMEIAKQHSLRLANPEHLLIVAASVMRRVLVNRAKHRDRLKRNEGRTPVTLDDASHLTYISFERQQIEVLQLDAALKRLEKHDQALSRLVELRYFGGCTIDEAATMLNISVSSANRDWRFAKTWLSTELGGEKSK